MAYQGSTPSSATDNADAATADNATTADAILATDTVLAARRQAIASAPDPHGLATEAEIRAALIDRHGIDVQNRLDAARVAIAGLGGLGSTIAVALTRIGVGHLHLVDFDRVDATNLNRQQYFLKDLGRHKTTALKANLAQINPYLDVTTDTTIVTPDNVEKLFGGDDIICEAFDVPENKTMLVNTVLERLPDHKLVCGSGMAGFRSSNLIATRRVSRNFYFCGDGETAPVPGAGLMAPRVGVVACHEANMIVRIILGENEA